MSLDLSMDGKAAVVTGASSGIGAEIAKALARAGAAVAVVGRDEGRLEATSTAIRDAGGEVVVIPVDVTTDEAPAQIVARAIAGVGRIDVLVNAAGVFLVGDAAETRETFDLQWRTNVRAPFMLTVEALPELRRNTGAVLFLSSIAGKVGFPGAVAYCTTKGAIELMTKGFALEEATHGVRVNAISPGNVETPMNAHLMADPDYLQAMLAATPLGRNGKVQDIAPMAVLLASDSGGWITGESIVIDGGWMAR
jgi:NAD(P)-dependent dehydrogenase (short-subunit alcohol dehydrogenase family)